jgi:hypothetical protein
VKLIKFATNRRGYIYKMETIGGFDDELANDMERNLRNRKPDEVLPSGFWRDNITGEVYRYAERDVPYKNSLDVGIHVSGYYVWDLDYEGEPPERFEIEQCRNIFTNKQFNPSAEEIVAIETFFMENV